MLAPVSPVPPTRTPRPAWKQRRRQHALRCRGRHAGRRGSDTLCRSSWSLGELVQRRHSSGRAEARPTASATVACTSHTKNSSPLPNISISCGHFKIKSFTFKVKNTRLFVTKMTHTPLSEAAEGCPLDSVRALLREPVPSHKASLCPALPHVLGSVLQSHPEGVKRCW